MEKKKVRTKLARMTSYILPMLAGGIAGIEGIRIGRYIFGKGSSIVQDILAIILSIVLMLIMFLVQTIIHEL